MPPSREDIQEGRSTVEGSRAFCAGPAIVELRLGWRYWNASNHTWLLCSGVESLNRLTD